MPTTVDTPNAPLELPRGDDSLTSLEDTLPADDQASEELSYAGGCFP